MLSCNAHPSSLLKATLCSDASTNGRLAICCSFQIFLNAILSNFNKHSEVPGKSPCNLFYEFFWSMIYAIKRDSFNASLLSAAKAHKGVIIREDGCLHFSESSETLILHQLPNHQTHLQGFTELHSNWCYHMQPVFHFVFWDWHKITTINLN